MHSAVNLSAYNLQISKMDLFTVSCQKHTLLTPQLSSAYQLDLLFSNQTHNTFGHQLYLSPLMQPNSHSINFRL